MWWYKFCFTVSSTDKYTMKNIQFLEIDRQASWKTYPNYRQMNTELDSHGWGPNCCTSGRIGLKKDELMTPDAHLKIKINELQFIRQELQIYKYICDINYVSSIYEKACLSRTLHPKIWADTPSRDIDWSVSIKGREIL